MWGCDELGEGWCGQNETALLSLLMWFFLVSVVHGGTSASPLGSRIFTMVSCIWVVASWSSHED